MKRKSKNKSKSSKTEKESKNQTPPASRLTEEVDDTPQMESPERTSHQHEIAAPIEDENLWKKSVEPEARERDEEFDEYLADLLL